MKLSEMLLIILFVVTALASPVMAQVEDTDAMTTDTVDLFSSGTVGATNELQSSKLVLFSNLAVPGLGYYMTGKKERAFAYLSAEAVCLVSAIVFKRYATRMVADSRNLAAQYAGCRSLRKDDDNYWDLMGNRYFQNTRQFNEAMKLNGSHELYYFDAQDRWQWESEAAQQRYRHIREKSHTFSTTSSFFIGALFLNHVISFVNYRFSSRSQYVATTPTDGVRLSEMVFSATSDGVGCFLVSSF